MGSKEHSEQSPTMPSSLFAFATAIPATAVPCSSQILRLYHNKTHPHLVMGHHRHPEHLWGRLIFSLRSGCEISMPESITTTITYQGFPMFYQRDFVLRDIRDTTVPHNLDH